MAGSRTCVTVIVLDATVSVPVRASPPFDATLKVAVPLPLPFAPDVIVIHDALLCAVHAHPFGAETDIDAPAPPPNGNDWDGPLTEYVHAGDGAGGAGVGGAGGVGAGGVGVGLGGVGAGASPAACDTVNGRSAIVIVPLLAPWEFDATRNSTAPLPSPLVPEVIVIQETSLLAVHVQV